MTKYRDRVDKLIIEKKNVCVPTTFYAFSWYAQPFMAIAYAQIHSDL